MILNYVCAKCGRSYGLEPQEVADFRNCLSCNGRLLRQEA